MTRQIPLPLPHDSLMGADDFLIADSNREAAAWIEKWPDWPAHGLIVTGLSGSGKTHLLTMFLTKCNGRLVSTPELETQNFESLTTTRFIAIDDADAICGNANAEENLFHLYNHLKTIKGSLLLTMKQGAGQCGFVLPDLRSRLLTLPAVGLNAPDDDLLEALIIKQFHDRQVTVDAGVVNYLIPRATRDAAGIRSLVDQLDHAALAEGKKITITLARKILEKDDRSKNI